MPKVSISNITPEQFALSISALGLSQTDLYMALRNKRVPRQQPTISGYTTGRLKVPEKVAVVMDELLNEARAKLGLPAMTGLHRFEEKAAHLNTVTMGNLVAARHAGTSAERATNREGRLMKRQALSPTAAPYPPYMVRARYSTVAVAALKDWGQHVVSLSRDPRYAASLPHQKDYRIELATIASIMASIPKEARGGSGCRFNLTLNELERLCFVSALVEAARKQGGKGQPRSLYTHYRRYCYAGFDGRNKSKATKIKEGIAALPQSTPHASVIPLRINATNASIDEILAETNSTQVCETESEFE